MIKRLILVNDKQKSVNKTGTEIWKFLISGCIDACQLYGGHLHFRRRAFPEPRYLNVKCSPIFLSTLLISLVKYAYLRGANTYQPMSPKFNPFDPTNHFFPTLNKKDFQSLPASPLVVYQTTRAFPLAAVPDCPHLDYCSGPECRNCDRCPLRLSLN